MRRLLLVAFLSAPACGGAPGKRHTPPASEGIEAFVASLRSDDPRAAYRLLADDLKARISFEDFAATWRQSAREREDQAAALEQELEASPGLGERAQIVYQDGKTAYLRREAGAWRIESAMVSRVHAGRPHDAVKIFAQALSQRDYEGVLRILTERRRAGIAAQVDSFVTSLIAHLAAADAAIEIIGEDRAELRWDDAGTRYKIVLRKEGAEWRIDDVHLRPTPPEPEAE